MQNNKCVSDNNGNIDISTPEKLYNFLMTEYGVKSDSDNTSR